MKLLGVANSLYTLWIMILRPTPPKVRGYNFGVCVFSWLRVARSGKNGQINLQYSIATTHCIDDAGKEQYQFENNVSD